MKKTIKLVGVESDLKKITLLEDIGKVDKNGEPKYSKLKIWIKKKDGSFTKSYQQFQKIMPNAGDVFDLEVAEEEKEYNGFPYTDRTVMFFYTQDAQGTPSQASQAPVSPPTPQSQPQVAPPDNSVLTEALKKIATHLNSIDVELERQKWFLDEILKRMDPGWKALSQDEIKPEELPK